MTEEWLWIEDKYQAWSSLIVYLWKWLSLMRVELIAYQSLVIFEFGCSTRIPLLIAFNYMLPFPIALTNKHLRPSPTQLKAKHMILDSKLTYPNATATAVFINNSQYRCWSKACRVIVADMKLFIVF